MTSLDSSKQGMAGCYSREQSRIGFGKHFEFGQNKQSFDIRKIFQACAPRSINEKTTSPKTGEVDGRCYFSSDNLQSFTNYNLPDPRCK